MPEKLTTLKVGREVIERKILAAFSDDEKVALLLNREELTLVITGLRSVHIGVDLPDIKDPYDKARGMAMDAMELRRQAFGEKPKGPVNQRLEYLKGRMDRAIAAFHRIPDECELDIIECARRIERMINAKLAYAAELDTEKRKR